MISQTAFLFTLLPLLTSAHFELHFPQSRGDNDDTQSNFPCGGLGTSNERTLVGLDGFPVSMELGHTENLLQILLGIGNDVGDAFNYELLPTIQEIGPGDFCLQRVVIPEGLNITDGTNATIQVITNAHSGGGLYNCADITFSESAPAEPASCVNGTGVTAEALPANEYTFANETHGHGGNSSSDSSSSSTSGTAPPASATESGSGTATGSGSGAAAATSATGGNGASSGATVGWGLLGAAVLGGVAFL